MSSVLMGRGKSFTEKPEAEWRAEIERAVSGPSPRLEFMSPEHHRVRDAVVVEVTRRGEALSYDDIAQATGLPRSEVEPIVVELERALFFLVRNEHERVEWAYPVTAAPTPHRMRLTSGEVLYAA